MVSRLLRFSSFWFYPCASGVLIQMARTLEPDRSVLAWLPWFAGGALLWTLIEYLLHRFFFHRTCGHPGLSRLLSGFHQAHHAETRDRRWILVRLRTSAPVSALILAAVYGLTGSPGSTAGTMAGIWAGFLYYEWVHYRIHTSASTLGLERKRARHFAHHFVNPQRSFGVTSPLWDVIFQTRTGDGREPGRPEHPAT